MVTEDLRFDGQVAVITGAGGGLGKEYALLLASRGARVVVNDIGGSVTSDGSDGKAADAVAREIRELAGQAIADGHSVTSPEGAAAIIDTAVSTWGQVDIVINNAGIVRDVPFEDMTIDQLDPLVDVHLRGAMAGRRAPPLIPKRPSTFARAAGPRPQRPSRFPIRLYAPAPTWPPRAGYSCHVHSAQLLQLAGGQ